jgi:spatacsin
VFEAGLALHGSMSSQAASLESMFRSKQMNHLLALLMYSPTHYEQMCSLPEFQNALNEFPRIQKFLANGNLDQVLAQDISVYQLLQVSSLHSLLSFLFFDSSLQGNAPFDPSRLFGWQSTNILATQGSAFLSVWHFTSVDTCAFFLDAPKELPHFSQKSLVKQYACKESLSFVYFLKQGRPTFAFCAYLHRELMIGNHRPSFKRYPL